LAPIIEKRRSLNKQLENQQMENDYLKARLTRLQTLANLGTVSAIVAHEINNILMPLGNYAQVALKAPDDKQLTQKALEKTIINSARASEILESILAVVNGETLKTRTCRLKNLVEEVFACIGRDFEKDGIKVNIDIHPDLDIHAVPVQLQQVLMNLILNAREAMANRNGILTITAKQLENEVVIEVADTGCGIEPENIENIFDSFFTTKTLNSPAARKGAGLGLAFCKEIIDSHNGSIAVQSNPQQGTRFVITLPGKTN